MKKIYILLAAAILTTQAFAQAPSKKQDKKIVIKNATVHIGNGKLLENATVVFDKGIITEVSTSGVNETGAQVIDAKGKHVYPGLIVADSRLGLEEIEAIRPTLDYYEVGEVNPNIRSVIAYNTDSKIIPTVRSNGVLLALSVPEGGIMPGTSSVMKMDGWNWEDAAYKMDAVTQLNWPSMSIRNAWWAPPAEEQRKQSAANMAMIKKFFEEAKAYNEQAPSIKNLKLEAMKSIFNGSKKLFINANSAKEITSAVLFAKSYNIKPVILGGSEAYLVADFLKENDIAVVAANPHSLPNYEDDDVDMPYRNAKVLHDKGVLYCLSINGSWQQRNLPFVAGTTAAYGLTKEEALQSVTLNTAKILGIDKTTGSIEVGKDANLLISEGDLLDMRTSNVTSAFIQGASIDLNNKQKELYKLYMEKYQLK
jgi:imidazolonepropionase-like amidohydrolase